MGVNDIRNEVRVEPNQVYINPPGKDVVIENRILYLREAMILLSFKDITET